MTGKASKQILLDLAVLLLVFIVYLPSLHSGFIWDDDAHVTRNPAVTTPSGLRATWTSGAATYYPLTLTTFWMENRLWGLNPLPFHLISILLHAFSTVLLSRILTELGATRIAALAGALFWAVHPVQVESVAWITELKNTQSGLFYVLTILLFLKWRRRSLIGRTSRLLYVLFLLSALCSLLSKTSTVMLPVVLGFCAWWLDGVLNWKTMRALLPFLAASGAAAGWTIWEQRFHSGAVGAEWAQRFLERFAVAGYSIWFYLGKLIWPQPLAFIYPRWSVDVRNPLAYLPLLAAIAVFPVLLHFRARGARPALFAFAYFAVSLFPVLDFFDVYFFRYSFVADHFLYLAAMGPLALAGVAATRKRPGLFVFLGLIVLLGVLSVRHERAFHDDEALWQDTIDKNPKAWMAYNNLAAIFMDRGDTASAVAELEATLSLRPQHTEARANLGNILLESGRFEEAASQFQLALAGDPDYARIQDSLGVALMMEGHLEEAIPHLQRALELESSNTTTREHLGLALGRQGNMNAALYQFQESVRIDPAALPPRMRYGTALLSLDKFAEAQTQFEEALRLSPDFAPAHKFLGITLVGLHRTEEGVRQLQEALRLDPTDEETKSKLRAAGK